ncbi:RNB domain-containing ribonuclease [Streptomyces sp. NA04227]|uniref:RNB domain-containing ribonuclease n=1 Tax=Streptomyces sp. NA04227 TaxID=2742136 RepID=UPI00158FD3A2|nr:RNB domain-containing ribonuclease [Streptomyces sp. NA04227]QKW06227.1 RNB domain-containing ribonuclease [Streptomyces sp. NA04227]
MPRRHVQVTGAEEAPLRTALRTLRRRLALPEGFPPEVLAEAERAAREPRLPSEDATDIPFFTLDPPASTDLDQAMHLAERADGGYRVRYAIADVAAFVRPHGALDAEAHHRVTTLYLPDGRIPLHPAPLSEAAASLLPGEERPAALWTLDLDAEGAVRSATVRRARVRSRAKLDYAGVQRQLDAGTAEAPLALLATIGRLREAQEVARGGVSLNVPEQEIQETVEHPAAAPQQLGTSYDGTGHEGTAPGATYELVHRATLPVEGWNAQISLLTGMAAADLMTGRGTGVLRTLPAAPDGAVGRLRRTAAALHIDWPHHVAYAQLIRSLDPALPRHAAFLQECTTLLRGAGYTVFRDGRLPSPLVHSAVAAPYTHCTAPLRRLVDRYTSEICLAACADVPVPGWVDEALDALPGEMAEGNRRGATVERECVDLVEAALLKDRVGEVFDGVVIDVREDEPVVGTVQLTEPAVVARITGGPAPLPLGERVRARLTEADPTAAKVRFAPA